MSSNRSTAASTHHHTPLAQHATNGATFRFCGDFAARSAYRVPGVMLVAVIKTKSSSTSNAAKVCLFRRNAALASRVFGSTMIAELTKSREVRVFRRLVPMIGLVAVWGVVVAAGPARAQVNIDQGKSTAEIFSGDCGTCHKTAKGLANGRNAGALAGFLREHYTSSAQQAASLAAYVLGAGSGPAPSAGLKPGTGGEQKTGEAKPGEAKPGDKTAAHSGRPEAGESAKLQQPDQDTKIEAEPAAAEPAPAGPARKPAAGKHEPRAVTASRGSKQGPEAPPPAPQAAPIVAPETVPAPVATAPAASEPANPEPSNSEASAPAVPQPAVPQPALSQPALPATAAAPNAVPDSGQAPNAAAPNAEATSSASAAAPAEASPSDSAPVPRDDIPD
jgi:hypothetical protein